MAATLLKPLEILVQPLHSRKPCEQQEMLADSHEQTMLRHT